MASSTTYNTAGNREDLTSILTVLEPEKTPLTSIAGKKKATGTHFEWQLDSLSDPSWSGVNEGEDISSFDNKAAARARVGNYIQKFRRTWMVSDLQQLVSTAGVASEAVNSASKSVRELKRDLESAICSVDDWAIENGTGTPYRTRGMLKWLGLGGQPADVPAAFQSVASDTTNPQTEVTFNSVLQSLYSANGMPNGQLTLIAGPTLKSEISNFSRAQVVADNGVYNITQSAESKKITLSVNLYEGDFGNVAIIPSTFVGRTRDTPGTADPDAGILVDPEYVDLFTLKAESADQLEDQGGGERGYCEIIAGLAVSPKAHGYFN